MLGDFVAQDQPSKPLRSQKWCHKNNRSSFRSCLKDWKSREFNQHFCLQASGLLSISRKTFCTKMRWSHFFFFALWFYCIYNPIWSCHAGHLTYLRRFWAGLDHLDGKPVLLGAHTFTTSWKLPFLNQWRGRIAVENISTQCMPLLSVKLFQVFRKKKEDNENWSNYFSSDVFCFLYGSSKAPLISFSLIQYIHQRYQPKMHFIAGKSKQVIHTCPSNHHLVSLEHNFQFSNLFQYICLDLYPEVFLLLFLCSPWKK